MQLVTKLVQDFPQFTFAPAAQAHWSPRSRTIFFENTDSIEAAWNVLHELGHAVLAHTDYHLDIELVRKEAAAWNHAASIASQYALAPISEAYVQASLDTYRDWLYQRSLCPRCRCTGLQQNLRQYICLNCAAHWHVSLARFCRAYRLRVEVVSAP